MKLDSRGDVGLVEDMIFTLKNLVAIEDHSATSYAMTKENKWIEVLELVRKIRTKWLSTIIKQEKSHLWCVSKHLLASIEGLIEVAVRFIQTKQKKEATEAYDDAMRLMDLFYFLNEYEAEEVKSSA